MTVFIPSPSSSSPLSAIQGNLAYGDGNPNTTTVISYNFDQYNGSQFWTDAYKDDFRAALAVIESVANIQFVEVGHWSQADIYEVIAPNSSSFFSSPSTLGYHFTPSNNPSEGAFSTDYWIAGPGGNGDPGGFFFTTLLHELGHALGLGHPHDTGLNTTVLNGVTSPFGSYGVGNLNQGVFTVMSYNDGWTARDGFLPVSATWGGSTGLGALDIAALQAMYGANTSHNSGTNSYELASYNTSGVGYQAIWDTGGVDAIRHFGSANAHIDLRPAAIDYSVIGGGGVSFVEGVKGGFTIAQGVVIEIASGGSGHDTIFGNAAENTLNGNGGNDTIHSRSNGANNNTINAGHGNDTIYAAIGVGADTINGNEGNDTAIVANNSGSFAGGTGTDTLRFVSAISSYLFLNNGTSYEFVNAITGVVFTAFTDVEVFQFANGAQSYDLSSLIAATQISDVETTGTILQHAAQGIYLLGGGASNIVVSRDGGTIGDSSIAGWEAIQVQSVAGGYKLLWRNLNGTYNEWTLDSEGRYVSDIGIGNVVDLEVFYGADINNDGTIGHVTTTIENSGSTTLASSTRGMYLIDGSVEITQNGVVMGPTSIAGWSAIQAEADGGGYRVLWQHTDGTYFEWTLDSQGEQTAGALVGNVIDVEAFYGVDINNDGQTGHFNTTIENSGSTTLASSTRGMYLIDGSVEITQNGVAMGPTSIAGWSAIQAEADGGGYRVLWQHTDGTYFEWTLDSQGEQTAGALVGNVIDVEAFYGVDINNDGQTGHFNTTIENSGSTTLASSTRGMYLIDGSVEITQNGVAMGPTSIAGWSAIQAEADGGGYRVLWQHTDGTYFEWTLDSQGEQTAGALVGNVIDVEAFYGVDINNDGQTGHFNTTIENSGSTTLASSTRGMYLIDGSVEITQNGVAMGPTSIAGWSAIQAEADGGGYRVLWQHTDGTYFEWTLDSQGEQTAGALVGNVIDVEAFYGVDINNDGQTGHFNTTIENSGSTTLASSTRGMYLIDGSVEITQNGVAMGPTSIAGWSAIQAEADGGGYRVLWQHTDGTYFEWTLDSQGEQTAGALVGNVIDVEAFYGVDINNDGTTGHALPSIAHPSIGAKQLAGSQPEVNTLQRDLIEDALEFIFASEENAGDGIGADEFSLEVADLIAGAEVELHDSGDMAQAETYLNVVTLLEDDLFLL